MRAQGGGWVVGWNRVSGQYPTGSVLRLRHTSVIGVSYGRAQEFFRSARATSAGFCNATLSFLAHPSVAVSGWGGEAMAADQAVTASADAEGGPDRAALPMMIKQGGFALSERSLIMILLVGVLLIYLVILFFDYSQLVKDQSQVNIALHEHRRGYIQIASVLLPFFTVSYAFTFFELLACRTYLSNDGVSRNFGFTGTVPWAALFSCELGRRERLGGFQRLRFHVRPEAYAHITVRHWRLLPSTRLRKGHFDVYFGPSIATRVAEGIAATCAAEIAKAHEREPVWTVVG